jgi:hypothetical protein
MIQKQYVKVVVLIFITVTLSVLRQISRTTITLNVASVVGLIPKKLCKSSPPQSNKKLKTMGPIKRPLLIKEVIK